MPYKMGWYLRDRVFVVEVYGKVTLEEVKGLLDDSQRFVSEGDQTMHSITDLLRLESAPTELKQIADALRKSGIKRNYAGWSIIASPFNPLFQFMVSYLSQMLGARFRFAQSFEEGLTFLNEQDATLPPLMPLYSNYLQASQEDSDAN